MQSCGRFYTTPVNRISYNTRLQTYNKHFCTILSTNKIHGKTVDLDGCSTISNLHSDNISDPESLSLEDPETCSISTMLFVRNSIGSNRLRNSIRRLFQ